MLSHRTASALSLRALFLIGSMIASPVPAKAGDSSHAVAGTAGASAWDTLVSGMLTGWSDLTALIGAVHIGKVPLGPVIIETRMACQAATGGGPAVCDSAVATVCGRNGYESGIHLDIETGVVCRGDQLIALRQTTDARCKPKAWTTRVMCW